VYAYCARLPVNRAFFAAIGENLYPMRLPGVCDFPLGFSFGRMDVQTIIRLYRRIPCVAGVPGGWSRGALVFGWPKIN
jgi:hypothetical protein